MRSARQSTRENEKPADQRAFVKLQHFGGNLERAKGLEPSTPTLARSCSTTELHPHPRWRRSLAVNGRAMPNADRECNSSLTVWTHPENLISAINGRESVRNNAETGFRWPIAGTWGLQPAFEGDSRPVTDQAPEPSRSFAAAANRPPPSSFRGRPIPRDRTEQRGGLNFAAKPPSSERELGAGPC